MLKEMLSVNTAGEILGRLYDTPGTTDSQQSIDFELLDTKGGEKWSVQFAVTVSNGSNPESRRITVQHFPGKSFLRARSKLEAVMNQLDKSSPLRNWVSTDPKRQLIATPFPVDIKLKSLKEATRLEDVLRVFGTRFPEIAADTFDVRIRPLRYVPGRRCQLHYAFQRNGSVSFNCLGKIFRDERGLKQSKLMNHVSNGFSERDTGKLSAARCLGYVPEWKMVVQEEVPGVTLHESILQGSWTKESFLWAARGIALLHGLDLGQLSCHTLDEELRLIERAWDRLRQAGLSTPGFRESLEFVKEVRPSPRGVAYAPVHRDYYDKQLMVASSQVTLIDLDTIASGSPELDVANFTAHIFLRHLQGHLELEDATALTTLFLAEYMQSGRELDQALLAFYQAATLFRLACKYHLLPGNSQVVEKLLELSICPPAYQHQPRLEEMNR